MRLIVRGKRPTEAAKRARRDEAAGDVAFYLDCLRAMRRRHAVERADLKASQARERATLALHLARARLGALG